MTFNYNHIPTSEDGIKAQVTLGPGLPASFSCENENDWALLRMSFQAPLGISWLQKQDFKRRAERGKCHSSLLGSDLPNTIVSSCCMAPVYLLVLR